MIVFPYLHIGLKQIIKRSLSAVLGDSVTHISERQNDEPFQLHQIFMLDFHEILKTSLRSNISISNEKMTIARL